MKGIKLNKKLLIIISCALIILTTAIIIILNKEKTYDFGLSIDNIDTYFPELSKNTRNLLFYNLYTQANSQLEEGLEMPESGAIIRDGTTNKTDNTYSFIVDIDALKQSYAVTIKLKENDIAFLCPTKDQIIYEGTFCEINTIGYSPSMSLKHGYLINSVVGSIKGQPIINTIEKIITDKKERVSAPSDHQQSTNFEVVLNEKSYTSHGQNIYSINASVDDGRGYSIFINNQDEDNIAVFITRTDIENHSTATIFSNNSDTAGLVSWIHSFSSDVEINYESL